MCESVKASSSRRCSHQDYTGNSFPESVKKGITDLVEY